MAKLRPRLTYANVMATIAVFVALGGTSYAVATGSIDSREIKNNTIRSKDIRNNDVRGKDIRKGTVKSSDVGDRSLLAADFKSGQLPAGPQGLTGATGATGAQGTARAYALVYPGSCTPTAGSCTLFRTKNITGVRRDDVGIYCVRAAADISGRTDGAMAGIDGGGTGDPKGNTNATTATSSNECSSDEFEVRTYRFTTGDALESNTVSFWFAVP